jgi:biofilm PGA synthesis N-glycosyltransferase PgaC
MISFYLLWTGCYFVLLGVLARKWPKFKPKAKFVDPLPSVTLLIPFRNELENLPKLIGELQKIEFPDLKIILIDDQSEDGSFTFLKEKIQTDQRIQILQSPEIGKKRAIEFGVNAAETELILCSDADCTFPINWVSQMISPFSEPKIQLVAGPVISHGSPAFFQRFQQIEWSSILLLTHYFFNKKRPIMCSGANLAYRKSAFEAVNAYDHNWQHLSGDDEFLLKKISKYFGGESCVYVPFLENVVYTKPQDSVSSLFSQRIRWAGKWKVHRDVSHALTAVFSFLVQFVWLGSIFLPGFGISGFLAFSAVWLGKIGAEKIALGRVLKSFGIVHSVFDFFITGIIHPIYVIFVALGSIWGKFIWKGRSN